ncbi:Hypothetical predicted protein [Octopus vulgaris]|nr:Hypothetical predicted protein [Octopus vulgaris]
MVPNKSGVRKTSTKPVTTNLKKLVNKAKTQTDSMNENIDVMRSIMLQQKTETLKPKVVSPPVQTTHTSDKEIEEVENMMNGILQS